MDRLARASNVFVALNIFIIQVILKYKGGTVNIRGLSGTGDVSGSDGGFHGGLGVEYKFRENWSVNGEWLYSAGDAGPGDGSVQNNNFTIGVNYYF